MKIRFALCLVLLGLAVLGPVTAQETDWVHAPLNPVGLGYQRAHFQLKGPLYATGRQIFDREGRLLGEESRVRYQDGLPVGQAGAKWETDAAGRVTKVTYPNRSFIQYTYEGGRMVEELESRQKIETRKRYRYDGRGRVDQITRISRDGEEVETLAYAEEGGRLIVRRSTRRGDEAPRERTQHYLDGYLVFAQSEGDPISLTVRYEFDAWGNPTTIRHEQNNGVVDTFTRSYHYYPDLEARNELTFGAIDPENPRSRLLPFRNGRQALDIEVRLIEGKGHLLYDPFSNSYYLADSFPEAQRGTHRTPRLLARDSEVLALSKGAQLLGFVRGMPVFVNANNRLVYLPDGDWLLYSEGARTRDRYSLLIHKEPGAEWFAGEILRETYDLFGSHNFYAINAAGNIDLIVSGNKQVGPFEEARTGEADLVLIEKGRPLYVLPNALKPPPPGVYEVRYFSTSTDTVEPIRKAAGHPLGLTPPEIAALIAATRALEPGYEQPFVHPILAPLNPIPHIRSLWDANLEDGVAATRIDFEMHYFDERGQRIYPTDDYFSDEALARAHRGVYLLFNQSGRLLIRRDFRDSEKTTVYTWNENGTVARRQVIVGEQVVVADSYIYDPKRRLIEHIQHRERSDHRVTYRYREAGKQLIVEEAAQQSTAAAELVYEGGRLVRRTLLPAAEHTPWTATYTFDEMGNPLQREGSDGVTLSFPTYYHSETWQPEAWTWRSVEREGAYYPELFVNGRFFAPLRGAYSETYPYPDGVHYEPIRQNYLVARGALLRESNQAGAGGPMDVVAAQNLVQIAPGGKFRIFLKGRNTSMSKAILLGGSIVLYDGRTRHSYLLPSVDIEKRGDYIPEDLGPDAALIYQETLDGNLTLLLNGESPPLDELSYGGTYPNGDRLLLLRGEPWRVLAAAHLDQLGRAYPLLEAKGRGLPPTAAAPAPAPAKPAPAPYRKGGPLTVKRLASGFEFLQNDAPVVAPASFQITPAGNGLAFYADAFYLTFPGLGGLAAGQTQVGEVVATAEYFAELNGGDLTLWRSGQIVPAESYQTFLCEDGARLVHIRKPSRSLVLGVDALPGGFAPVRKWVPYSLIKNANGFQCIERGQVLEGAVLHQVNGNLVVYVESDPYFVLERFASIDEVPIGIHELKEFSY